MDKWISIGGLVFQVSIDSALPETVEQALVNYRSVPLSIYTSTSEMKFQDSARRQFGAHYENSKLREKWCTHSFDHVHLLPHGVACIWLSIMWVVTTRTMHSFASGPRLFTAQTKFPFNLRPSRWCQSASVRISHSSRTVHSYKHTSTHLIWTHQLTNQKRTCAHYAHINTHARKQTTTYMPRNGLSYSRFLRFT